MKAMNMMQTYINQHPGSPRVKDATDIIDKCRQKLEEKEYRTALLYYNLGQFKASAVAYTNLLNNYPESVTADEYKLMVVKSYYRYAKLSIAEKQEERYEKVTEEYEDFMDRFPESSLLKQAEEFSNLSKNHIKEIQNEQTTSATKR